MNPEDIAKVLDEIGERIGPLGSAAWDILVFGTWANALVGTLLGLAIFVGGLYAAKRMWEAAKVEAAKDRYSDVAAFFQIGAWFVLPLTTVIGIGMASYNAVGVIAPEFRVLENMLQALAGR